MLTTGQAAQRLGGALSSRSIRRMAATGEIVGARRTPGGRYRIPEQSVDLLLRPVRRP